MTITITDVNDNSPSDIALSASSASETAAAGTDVGTLSATDVDTSGTYTYTLVTDANGNTDYTGTDWAIDGTTLEVGSNPDFDYETSQSATIFVKVSDGTNAAYVEEMTITISDAGISITANSANLAENAADGVTVLTMASTGDSADGDGWSISAGNDDGNFAIASGTGVLTVATDAALDFESEDTYTLTIAISDVRQR